MVGFAFPLLTPITIKLRNDPARKQQNLLATDIDFGKRIRTLGEIKKVLAKTKK